MGFGPDHNLDPYGQMKLARILIMYTGNCKQSGFILQI